MCPSFFSDDASSSVGAGSRSSFQREPGHLTPSHFARSSSLGGHTRASTATASSQPHSAGQESGFQSCTSLVSLSQQKHSLFRGSPLPLHQRLQQDMERAESSLSGSMASLASGVIVPSLVNGMMRHSINSGTPISRPESRLLNQNQRRSARQLQVQEKHREPLIDPREHFSPVNQPHWVLKPLFFEVPQRDPNPIFVGRQWLYGEAVEHLASNLPTNRGLVISGGPGTGKTSLLLKLVEMSCFGRGEPIYQGKSFVSIVFPRKFQTDQSALEFSAFVLILTENLADFS